MKVNGERISTLANFFVFLFFVLLSLLMTYPLLLDISNRILADPGDPLLNTWVLGWNIAHFKSLDFANLFHGNFFHPHSNTLAYSEQLLAPALVGMPLMIATGNPILTYNSLFILAMAVSAFGMYLLAYHFTKEKIPSILSGVIFGFFPFHFAHLAHLQMQMAFGIPLTLLYLHKYLETARLSFLAAFTGFVVLQFLSCGYYAIFLIPCVMIVLAVEFVRRDTAPASLAYVMAALAFAGLVLLPVFFPYLVVKKEMGFVRSLAENAHFSASFMSYFSAPGSNRVWGSLTRRFSRPEAELFLGLVPLALALVGTVPNLGQISRQIWTGRIRALRGFAKKVQLCFAMLAAFWFVMTAIALVSGGFEFHILSHKARLATLTKPLALSLISASLWLFMISLSKEPLYRGRESSKHRLPYLVLLAFGLLLSLGPTVTVPGLNISLPGPHLLFYKYFPGFDGLRVPARAGIIVALVASLLAAFGARHVLSFRSNRGRYALALIIGLCIGIEYCHVPVLTTKVPVGNEVPAVYTWLRQQDKETVVVELPMPKDLSSAWKETKYMYFSLYHGRSLINGFSGYFPPDYKSLLKTVSEFPTIRSIRRLKELGAHYMIVHTDAYSGQEGAAITKNIGDFRDQMDLIGRFGPDFVYRLKE